MNGLKGTLLLLLMLCVGAAIAGDHNILNYGVGTDSTKPSTAGIQKAIDQCHAEGGGTVLVPAGTYLSAMIQLKTNVNLHLAAGAIIKALANGSDYESLVSINGAENVRLTGKGTLFGNGTQFIIEESAKGRPRIVSVKHSKNVLIEDIHLRNGASWTLALYGNEKVVIRNISIYSHGNFNNDGIDIDSKDVTITGCTVDCSDDALCLKSDNPNKICENITITNCVAASNCNLIKMGTSSVSGFRNIKISNCVLRRASESPVHQWHKNPAHFIDDSITGISGIALEIVDGALMDNVTISDISMTGVQTPIFLRLGSRKNPTGTMKNIKISNIKATAHSRMASIISGVPGHDIENVELRNIIIDCKGGGTAADAARVMPEKESDYPENRMFGWSTPAYGLYIRHAKNILLQDIRLHLKNSDMRPAVCLDDTEGIQIKKLNADRPANGAEWLKQINARDTTTHLTSYVNPFIGTAGTGHTFPGATLPLGMVQLSPETGYAGWEYCSGYRYEDSTILGFSHTHLSGTGALDLGDILLMPFTGNVRRESYKSRFSHSNEKAAAGYYEVELKDNDAHAALTVTPHAGFHRYNYRGSKPANMLLDLRHGLVGKSPGRLEQHVVSSELKIEDSRTITGYTRTKGWAGDKYVYFIIRLQYPISSHTWLSDSTENRNQRIVLSFANLTGRQQLAKLGISTVSIANARENLDTELKDWDFEATKTAADQTWERYLATIEVEGSVKQKTTFYTALYHSLIAPNNIADVNGQYRGADNQVYIASNKAYYSTLSLWDTYRALNPLYTMLYPGKTNEIVASMIAHAQVAGFLPIWTLWGHENYCMIGNHAIPVIVDAYLKGIRNYDVGKAYEVIRNSSTINHKNSRWDLYTRYGYLPSDSVRVEAVSTTLESGYDDWCVAQMAKALGKKEDYELFSRRALFYKNLFDRTTGLMRGRTSTGEWVTPFDPLKISHASSAGGDYTEGNAWHYTWHVQQDVNGLIQLMGGKEAFVRKLDSLFAMKSKVYGDGATVDVSGLIGQYVQGNEPSHHVAYLYTLAGTPAKTQEKVHTIVNTLYSDTPDGLSGNDDCGQMSAWYIFSTLGFYPVNPASGQYVFGTPAFSKAVLEAGDKTFTVKALNYAPANKYIKSIRLNGKEYKLPYITHADIMKGGVLEFVMEEETAAVVAKTDPLLPYLRSKPAKLTILNTREDSIRVKRFTFPSRNGANTIYGAIASPKISGTYPALLMLHGGGSCADEVGRLQKCFASKGYVVMAVDLPGICNPDKATLSTGAWRYRPKGIDSRLDISKGMDSSTLVDAIAAALEGFNLLAAEQNVDTSRIGITGFSWGGYMTTMLSSLLRHRVKAAYSVFGSGFYDRGSLWKAQLDTMQENKRVEWLTFFDAGRRAPGMQCPYFLEATVNDRFFWPEAVAATLDTIKAEKNLLWSPNLDHTRPTGAEQMQVSYFNYYLKSEGKPFGKVHIDKTVPANNNGKQLFLSVSMPQGITADSVLLYYSNKKPKIRNRRWIAIPAMKLTDKNYRVIIPGELLARGIDYYVHVTDSRKTSVSTAIRM